MNIQSIFGSISALEDKKFPNNWEEKITQAVNIHGVEQSLNGDSETSFHAENPISVSVLDGCGIKDHLPWLYELYTNYFLGKAAELSGRKLFVANDVRSAININKISGMSASYEWHVDSNPVTGLLFVNTLKASDGGELTFKNDNKLEKIRPQSGVFIAFDAREIPHCVEPLSKDITRISLPMNFYESATVQKRPADLDEYLYEKKH